MERIYLSAKRISEIYKDLTHLFLDNKTQNNKIQNIQIDKIITDELEYFELLASKKNISSTKEIIPTTIKIQEDDFKRIFSNILSNAIKYNNRNGEIFITLKDKKLTIKDTGIGISQNNLNNIFTRYFRATSLEGGFGMGLNIVQQICSKYDIKIKVDSEPKKGTTFMLDFSKL
jgi:two-component system OmpR family sensor kinase